MKSLAGSHSIFLVGLILLRRVSSTFLITPAISNKRTPCASFRWPEHKFGSRNHSVAMAMAIASPWTATSVSNLLRRRNSSSSSQRSCRLSVKSNGVQVPLWRVHCRLSSSPQSGRLSGRRATVVAPRAITNEEQQTTTVSIKEFLEDLKAVGRVRLIVNTGVAVLESVTNLDKLFYHILPGRGEYANLMLKEDNVDFHLLIDQVVSAKLETGKSMRGDIPTYMVRIMDVNEAVAASLLVMWKPGTNGDYDDGQVVSVAVSSLRRADADDLPLVNKFLLQSATSTNIKLIIQQLREHLQFVTISDIACEATLKEIRSLEGLQKHKVVDNWLLLIIHANGAPHRKAAESLLKRKDYFKALLSVGESFLRNTELATQEFGNQVYMLLFEEFIGDFYKREVLGSFITHIGSGISTEIGAALDTLWLITKKKAPRAPANVDFLEWHTGLIRRFSGHASPPGLQNILSYHHGCPRAQGGF